MNLEEDQVGVVLLGEFTEIKEGDEVKRTGRIMSVPVGDAMIGRVLNPLGVPIDGKGPLETENFSDSRSGLQASSTGNRCANRCRLHESHRQHDPIGRGQRELIIGDRQPERRRLRLIPSSIERARMSYASTWQSGRNALRSRAS